MAAIVKTVRRDYGDWLRVLQLIELERPRQPTS